jgi:cation diffusion facilitator CzcD-associated flavoprotein CzcO
MLRKGARCDVESYIYIPLLEETGFIPTEKYSTGKEILKHVNAVVEKWGLKEKALFNTVATEGKWEDKKNHWVVKTNNGDVLRAKYLITSTGILHTPKLPGIPGLKSFKGHSFHTTKWDYDYTGGADDGILSKLKDKRVAIIGTGATSIQIVPEVSKYAKKLYVFQRTPSAINIRNNRATPPEFGASQKPGWQRARQENFNSILAGIPVTEDLVDDGWTDMKTTAIFGSESNSLDPAKMMEAMALADYEKMERIRARVDQIVKDKTTAEKLKPWYPTMCKRPCFHDEYLQSFNRPSTELVDTDGQGVQRIYEKGLIANGKEYEVDLIIYSTGFAPPTQGWSRNGIKLTGRDGLTLADKYKDGMSTYFGIHSRGFPNYFTLGVTQAGATANFVYTLSIASQHIGYVVSESERIGLKTIEPTRAAENAWVKGILEGSQMMMSIFKNCTPSYFNNEGAAEGVNGHEAPYGGGASAWAHLLEEWRQQGSMVGLQSLVRDARL